MKSMTLRILAIGIIFLASYNYISLRFSDELFAFSLFLSAVFIYLSELIKNLNKEKEQNRQLTNFTLDL